MLLVWLGLGISLIVGFVALVRTHAGMGVDQRPQLLCSQCRRFQGVDEDSAVCQYCMAPLSRKQVSVAGLCQRNRVAHENLCNVRGKTFWGTCWVIVLGFIIMNLMHNSIADVLIVMGIVSVPIAGWRYTRTRVEPRYPEIFASTIFRYGIPEDPPERQLTEFHE